VDGAAVDKLTASASVIGNILRILDIVVSSFLSHRLDLFFSALIPVNEIAAQNQERLEIRSGYINEV